MNTLSITAGAILICIHLIALLYAIKKRQLRDAAIIGGLSIFWIVAILTEYLF